MVSPAIWLVLVSTAAGVTAQSQQVTVLMNSTRVAYGLGGQPTTLAGITNGGRSAAFLGQCGSFVGLYATDSAASLLFIGTSVTINVLADQARGGPYDIYLDGALKQQENNYAADGSNPFSNLCKIIPVSIANLPNTVHNITVVNFNGGLQELLVQSFIYIGSPTAPTVMVSASSSSLPSNTSTPTSTTTTTPSATQVTASTKKHHSVGPLIGEIIAAVAIIALIIASCYYCRSRQNLSRNINLARGDRTPPIVIDDDHNKYGNAPHQMPVMPSAPSGTGAGHTTPTLGMGTQYTNAPSVEARPKNPQFVAADSKSPHSGQPLAFGGMKPASGLSEHQNPMSHTDQTQRKSTAPSTTSQSQVDIIQAMLARGTPNEEITAMIKTMAANGGSGTRGDQGGGNAQGQRHQLVAGTPPRYDFKG
ncbi:hypothetical protein FRB95_009613 [Tulasnella sp. JGI-2019a]|nr:hypothetical protein FRB95_009613 [Tulasnella sp. JGI-2019a]